jgi:hypothetical protein
LSQARWPTITACSPGIGDALVHRLAEVDAIGEHLVSRAASFTDAAANLISRERNADPPALALSQRLEVCNLDGKTGGHVRKEPMTAAERQRRAAAVTGQAHDIEIQHRH